MKWLLYVAPLYVLYRTRQIIITDCDEVYNYWEPLHYMLFGYGQKTWEYHYGLRSYVYLEPLKRVAQCIRTIMPATLSKLQVFVLLKQTLAGITALLEVTWLYHVPHTSIFLVVLLLCNAGMSHASNALLPSATFLQAYLLCSTLFLRHQHYLFVVAAITFTLFCAWPFGAVVLLPFGIHILLRERYHLLRFLLFTITVTVVVQAIVTYIDSTYYGKLSFPTLEIFRYNVSHNNDTLYGVEPLSYYIKNLILNFNVGIVGLLVLPTLILTRQRTKELRTLVYPLYLWMAVTFPRPHKEERFLYPIYPVLVFSAYYFVDTTFNLVGRIMSGLSRHKQLLQRQRNVLHTIFWTPVILLSISRSVALQKYYQAPIHEVYEFVSSLPGSNTICTAGEWYRFPSSFYLSNGSELRFLPSSFKGQLPQPFGANQPFNDQNQHEPSRYVSESTCDYVVDLENSDLQLGGTYETVFRRKYMDGENTETLHRTLYIPWYHELAEEQGKIQYLQYVVRKRVEKEEEPG